MRQRNAGGGHVGLELQRLQLDLQQIDLAHGAGFVLFLADAYRVLIALQKLHRKIKIRLGQQSGHKLLRRVGDGGAFQVQRLRGRNGSRVLGSLQAVLPLLSALEQIPDAQIELRRVVDVVGRKQVGAEDRKILRVRREQRDWAADWR